MPLNPHALFSNDLLTKTLWAAQTLTHTATSKSYSSGFLLNTLIKQKYFFHIS